MPAVILGGRHQHELNNVQEDIELLSFSAPSLLQNQKRNFAEHGLPLKAVYRDCIVGVRYLHPRVVPEGASPVSPLYLPHVPRTSR